METDPLVALADALYGLTPGEFTAARDREAKAVRADGDRETADRLKRLRRPTAAAWVVNMLMRHRADQMDQVLGLGNALRKAQGDLDGDALRELTRQRRRLIAAVAGDGRALARELGVPVSEAVARQVEQTLHAAMVDTDAAAAVRTGLLLDPLEPVGVGTHVAAAASRTALGALDVPAPTPAAEPPPRLLSVVREPGDGAEADLPEAPPEGDAAAVDAEEQRRQAVAAADRAVEEAEDAADQARRRWRKADRRVGRLEAQGLQLSAQAEELRRRLAEVEFEAEALEEETSEAEERRERRQARLDAAELALEQARQRRADLAD